MSDYTTIMVSKENRYKLANFGKAGQSLNDALSSILAKFEAEE